MQIWRSPSLHDFGSVFNKGYLHLQNGKCLTKTYDLVNALLGVLPGPWKVPMKRMEPEA